MSDLVTDKWGNDITSWGFQQIPNLLIWYQAELGLSCTDLVVLLNLLNRWWFKERKPFIRTGDLVGFIGADPRTIRKSLKNLKDKSYIASVSEYDDFRRRSYKKYEFPGLFKELEKYAAIDDDKKKFYKRKKGVAS